ncbi:MAG: hypothetical protein AAF654_02720 [Myxococcota bacterium]
MISRCVEAGAESKKRCAKLVRLMRGSGKEQATSEAQDVSDELPIKVVNMATGTLVELVKSVLEPSGWSLEFYASENQEGGVSKLQGRMIAVFNGVERPEQNPVFVVGSLSDKTQKAALYEQLAAAAVDVTQVPAPGALSLLAKLTRGALTLTVCVFVSVLGLLFLYISYVFVRSFWRYAWPSQRRVFISKCLKDGRESDELALALEQRWSFFGKPPSGSLLPSAYFDRQLDFAALDLVSAKFDATKIPSLEVSGVKLSVLAKLVTSVIKPSGWSIEVEVTEGAGVLRGRVRSALHGAKMRTSEHVDSSEEDSREAFYDRLVVEMFHSVYPTELEEVVSKGMSTPTETKLDALARHLRGRSMLRLYRWTGNTAALDEAARGLEELTNRHPAFVGGKILGGIAFTEQKRDRDAIALLREATDLLDERGQSSDERAVEVRFFLAQRLARRPTTRDKREAQLLLQENLAALAELSRKGEIVAELSVLTCIELANTYGRAITSLRVDPNREPIEEIVQSSKEDKRSLATLNGETPKHEDTGKPSQLPDRLSEAASLLLRGAESIRTKDDNGPPKDSLDYLGARIHAVRASVGLRSAVFKRDDEFKDLVRKAKEDFKIARKMLPNDYELLKRYGQLLALRPRSSFEDTESRLATLLDAQRYLAHAMVLQPFDVGLREILAGVLLERAVLGSEFRLIAEAQQILKPKSGTAVPGGIWSRLLTDILTVADIVMRYGEENESTLRSADRNALLRVAANGENEAAAWSGDELMRARANYLSFVAYGVLRSLSSRGVSRDDETEWQNRAESQRALLKRAATGSAHKSAYALEFERLARELVEAGYSSDRTPLLIPAFFE